MEYPVIIMGGGIGGCASALKLADNGYLVKAFTYLQNGCIFHNPTLNKPWNSYEPYRRAWIRMLNKVRIKGSPIRYRYPSKHDILMPLLYYLKGKTLCGCLSSLGILMLELL